MTLTPPLQAAIDDTAKALAQAADALIEAELCRRLIEHHGGRQEVQDAIVEFLRNLTATGTAHIPFPPFPTGDRQ